MHEVDFERRPALPLRRLVPLLVLAAAIGGFFALGLGRYLTFAALAEHRAELAAEIDRLGPLAALGYVAVYTAVAALSVPGAAVLTIAGGLLFGTALGGFYALLGATLGACILFLVARTSLGEPLHRRAGPAMRRLAAGFQANAASYLLVLRLVPLVPFWVVNLIPAFLGVRLRVFAICSFLGMAPGAFIYASLGQGLSAVLAEGRTPEPGMVLEPRVLLPLLGLAALGLLPVIYRRWSKRAPP